MKIETEPHAYGFLAGLIVMLIGVVAACASCASAIRVHTTGVPRTGPQQLSDTYRVTTWCINDADPETGVGISRQGGSAVMIDAHHLLTALHVVQCSEGTAAVTVVSPDGHHYDARVQREWDDKDVAALYIHLALPGGDVAIGPMPKAGDGICTQIAHPAFGAVCGEVTSVEPLRPEADIVHTAATEHGHSGGGAYDSEGRLVGIVTQLVLCSPFLPFSCGGRVSSIQGLGL